MVETCCLTACLHLCPRFSQPPPRSTTTVEGVHTTVKHVSQSFFADFTCTVAATSGNDALRRSSPPTLNHPSHSNAAPHTFSIRVEWRPEARCQHRVFACCQRVVCDEQYSQRRD